MPFNALPHEVVELIIDSISDGPKEYREYALVSKAWFTRCRHHGFGELILEALDGGDTPHDIGRRISPFVRKLTLQLIPAVMEERGAGKGNWINVALWTSLQRVTIQYTEYTHKICLLHQSLLTAVRGNAPAIEMVCNGSIGKRAFCKYLAPILCEARELYMELPFELEPTQGREQTIWCAPPQAQYLTLVAGKHEDIELFAALFSTAGPIRLRSLVINGWCSQWQEVIRNLGPSLEHFVLLTSTFPNPDSETYPITSPDLSANPNLKNVGHHCWDAVVPSIGSLMPWLFTIPSSNTNINFLIHANGGEQTWTVYRETIKRLAVTWPRASFQLYNDGLNEAFHDHETRPIPHNQDPVIFMQHYFPELYRAGRLTYMHQGLQYYTSSDLK